MSATDALRKRFVLFRKYKGYTLRQMAKMTGISNPQISQFENGHSGLSYENAMILENIMRSEGEPTVCSKCAGKGFL